MTETTGSTRGRTVLTNAAWLYGARGVTYALPLLTIPYLTRVLGVSAWGDVVFAQVTGILLSLLIDFGFGWSATREVARWRDDPARLGGVLSGVLGAKLLLAGIVLLLAALLALAFPAHVRDRPLMVLSTLFLVLAQGFNTYWYHQGRERMAVPALLDAAGCLVYAGGILWLVRGPDDGWVVVALQGVSAAVATGGSLGLAARATRVPRPTAAAVRRALAVGRGAFLYRLAVGAQIHASSFVLGSLTSGATLGLFAGAEKVVKAMISAVAISSEVLFPRVSRLLHESQQGAAAFSLLTTSILVVGGCAVAAGLGLAAERLLPLLLGPAFAAAVPIFRVALCALPFTCLTASLGAQWLLPLGGERGLSAITIGGVGANVVLMLILVPRFGGVGAAWAMLLSEAAVAAAILIVLLRRDMTPMQLWLRSRGRGTGRGPAAANLFCRR